jgi:TM2 domain-containing membrane protein YozV
MGVHNFYLGKILWGLLYLALLGMGWLLFLGGALAASSQGSADAATGAVALGMAALIALGLLLFWDLFTIPWQVSRREKQIQEHVLARLRK